MKKYGLSLLIILLFLVVYVQNLGTVKSDIEETNGTNVIENINMGLVIEQKFISSQNKLCGIAVQFGTYARENEGYIKLQLLDQSNHKIATSRVSKKNIEDNVYYEWFFPPIKRSLNHQYTLKIIDETTIENNEITLYKNNSRSQENLMLLKNGVEEKGNLNLITYYINT